MLGSATNPAPLPTPQLHGAHGHTLAANATRCKHSAYRQIQEKEGGRGGGGRNEAAGGQVREGGRKRTKRSTERCSWGRGGGGGAEGRKRCSERGVGGQSYTLLRATKARVWMKRANGTSKLSAAPATRTAAAWGRKADFPNAGAASTSRYLQLRGWGWGRGVRTVWV